MKVKSERGVTQSCPTLSDPMDCSLPGSSVHGIFQARVLEWGANYMWNLKTKTKEHNKTNRVRCREQTGGCRGEGSQGLGEERDEGD